MSGRNERGRRAAGLSLIEVLVVIALLTVLMTPLFLLLQQGTREITMTADQFRAHLAATEILDQLLALPYDDLPIRSFTDTELSEGKPIDRDGRLIFHATTQKGFEREAVITRVERSGYVRFKRISVAVRYAGGKGGPAARVLQLDCLRANQTD